uniref:Protein phosphatase methylesterase 1 n=1 Tax=Tetraselmis sp. GSL018 TaxID=582737 RepID=A0A061R2D0_9CHLO
MASFPVARQTAASCPRLFSKPAVPGSSEHLDPIPDSSESASGSEDAPRPSPLHSSRRRQCHLTGWDAYFDRCEDLTLIDRGGTFRVYTAGSVGPILFCIHGAGYTGLTWSLIASRLKKEYRVVAFDQRGHGATGTYHDDDFSLETLADDAVAVWKAACGEAATATVVIGHSMGGAVAVKAASLGAIRPLEGVAVIDVVEGTALAALPAMMGILRQRPPEFTALDVAFEWALTSGVTRNPEAASVSLPSQLTPPTEENPNLRWITPLAKTQPYWEGWYRGLSSEFLKLPCARLLILAGTDRLDKELTIGQMQGKFKLTLLPVAGHAIHEDEPDSTAEAMQSFLNHFRVGKPAQLPFGSWGAKR